MILGVSWCLPCLTIAKGTGGFPSSTSKISIHASVPSEKETKNRLCNIQANGSNFPSILPHCTTLIDTTFHASNTLLKLALLQKRNSSHQPDNTNNNFSNSTRYTVALPQHISDPRNRRTDDILFDASHSSKLKDNSLCCDNIKGRSQSLANLDLMLPNHSFSSGPVDSLSASDDKPSLNTTKRSLDQPSSLVKQESAAFVRPCLRHRRSSYDDILGKSTGKKLNGYSSLDNKLLNDKTALKNDSTDLASEDVSCSTQPLNKTVKFILPESSRHKKEQILESASMTVLNSTIGGYPNISPETFPLAHLSQIPYNCLMQTQKDYYTSYGAKSTLLPYADYIPSETDFPRGTNANHSFMLPGSHMEPSSSHKANYLFHGSPFYRSSINSSLSSITQHIEKVNGDIPLEKPKFAKCAALPKTDIPSAICWSAGYMYNPSLYCPTMPTAVPFCTSCCWNCPKDKYSLLLPPNDKSGELIEQVSISKNLASSKISNHSSDKPSNVLQYPLSDNEGDDDTDSEEQSTEGEFVVTAYMSLFPLSSSVANGNLFSLRFG